VAAIRTQSLNFSLAKKASRFFRKSPARRVCLNEYERWEARFAVPEYAFGKEPNEFLKSCKHLLPPSGRALAVADGEGRNGVWLAEQGLDVLAIDFSPSAQRKARALAAERHDDVTFVQADVHGWDYPQSAFDVVVEIFAQFSAPAERSRKWAGVRRALKSGGLLIIQGYTPKQLEYATGGPKQLENLYTRTMLERAFGDFRHLAIVEEERELREGASHAGMSALIGLTARKKA
jgi:SAM-dependent methyltransferase